MSFGNHSKSIETLKIELTTITTERNDLKIKYAELNNNYTILIEKVRTNRKQSHRMNMPRGGNAEKLTFDWLKAHPKYGC